MNSKVDQKYPKGDFKRNYLVFQTISQKLFWLSLTGKLILR